MAGAETLPLYDDLHGSVARGLRRHLLALWSHDDADSGCTRVHHGREHVAEHGAVGDFMQDLGPVRAHPRALTGRQNDSQTGSRRMWGTRI